MTAFAPWVAGSMLAQGVLALVLLAVLGFIRVPLVARGAVRMRDIALSREPWPDHAQRVSNAFDSQFQLPVLFFVAGALSLWMGSIWIEAVFAVLFVLSRLVHGAILAWRNHVPTRFVAFLVGYVVLVAFWGELALRLFFLTIWNRV